MAAGKIHTRALDESIAPILDFTVFMTVLYLKGKPSFVEATLRCRHREIGTKSLPHGPNGSWGKHIRTDVFLYAYNINVNIYIYMIKCDRYRYTREHVSVMFICIFQRYKYKFTSPMCVCMNM